MSYAGILEKTAEELQTKAQDDYNALQQKLRKLMDVEDIPIIVSDVKVDPDQVAAFYPGAKVDNEEYHGGVHVAGQSPLAVLAHELGHAKQHKARGPFLKKYKNRIDHTLAGTSIIGTILATVFGRKAVMSAARKLSGRTGVLKRIGGLLSHKASPYVGGGLAGLGVGGGMNYPLLSEEWGASSEALDALKHLRSVGDLEKDRELLTKYYKTYRNPAVMRTAIGTLLGMR